jgi:hypothetical protein
MFSPQTEAALAANLGAEAGQPWTIPLTAEVYRELVCAARQWDAFRAGPVNRGANVALVPQPDGSLRIEAAYAPRLTPVGAGDGNTFAVG